MEVPEFENKITETSADTPEDAHIHKGRAGAGAEVYDWLQSVVSALLFCVIVFVFCARMIGVVGSSMVPTLHEGDRVIISNLFYTPEQGDIVVLRKDSFRDDAIVKRIIATQGQTVKIDFDLGIVYVDGEELSEPYINELTFDRQDFDGEETVPEGCVFVMGDNRNGSTDSRTASIGMVDTRYILGRVLIRVLPFADFGTVN